MGMFLEDTHPVNGSQTQIAFIMITVNHHFSSHKLERKSILYCQEKGQFYVMIVMVRYLVVIKPF